MTLEEHSEIEPISPSAAHERIHAEITRRLGENWRNQETKWIMVDDGAYYVRLTNGKFNLDFECDLLGEVTVTKRELNPVQLSGRLLAWALLLASLFLAFVIASVAGVLTP